MCTLYIRDLPMGETEQLQMVPTLKLIHYKKIDQNHRKIIKL